ncbi:MAG TPA: hypothetical protein VGF25_18320 [Thermoleophilaceae bacterium]|jgi:hypothetical protein
MPDSQSQSRRARRGRFSPEVIRLLDGIRRLVAEQERLPDSGGSRRREAYRREIARMQALLADAVRRDLSGGLT